MKRSVLIILQISKQSDQYGDDCAGQSGCQQQLDTSETARHLIQKEKNIFHVSPFLSFARSSALEHIPVRQLSGYYDGDHRRHTH